MTKLSIVGSLTIGPYKGYFGHAEFDAEAGSFHGEVKDTRDVITFVGDDPTSVEAAFRESIEDYLAFCKELGREPEKPFSGNFLVRATPKLHRQLSYCASQSGESLNLFVVNVLERQVSGAISFTHTSIPANAVMISSGSILSHNIELSKSIGEVSLRSNRFKVSQTTAADQPYMKVV